MPGRPALSGLVLALAGPALAGPALAGPDLAGPAAPASAAPEPAGAAGCPASGVTVVVDFGALGGGIRTGCAADAPGSGTAAVTEAGFEITGVVTQPGFVCRLDGRPAPAEEDCRRTPPADAYWGLFVADRAGAAWSYATVGLDSVEPAAGGFVGFRWQDGAGRVPPGRQQVAGAGTGVASTAGPADLDAGKTGQTGQTGAAGASGGPASDGSRTALVPVAAGLVAGLLGATYLLARRRRGTG